MLLHYAFVNAQRNVFFFFLNLFIDFCVFPNSSEIATANVKRDRSRIERSFIEFLHIDRMLRKDLFII